MKVIIESRIRDPASAGGVSQAIISLATALSCLNDCRPDETFTFVVLESAGDWLDNHVSGPCRLHKTTLKRKNEPAATSFGLAVRPLLRAIRMWRPQLEKNIALPDGLAEALGADVVHFPFPKGYLTRLPSIYQPHDLQHLHFPQFFSPSSLAWRNRAYPAYCAQAGLVLVESTWTKEDVARQYGIAEDKIAVCTFPPATTGYREPVQEEIAALTQKLRNARFIFYPAQTWPHKNHLRLIEALALLKEQNVVVPLVCTGRVTPFSAQIKAAIQKFNLFDQVQFMGYRSETEIKILYRLCTAVVVPTQFESVSFPIWEAFDAGKPVACSTATSLPAQVGDAGLLFDPEDPKAIAIAIRALWETPELCEKLGRLGTERLRQFSPDRFALHIRALYRYLAGTTDARDREILAAPPLI
jgi:glycosyltransferase involved in cell wall biosynthesis